VSRVQRRPRLCSAAVSILRRAPWLATPLVQAIHRPFDLNLLPRAYETKWNIV
jgi:hypothetical protein